jgi:hypothetical protein
MFHDQAMAERWIIQVEGKDYGPADLDTLREWKADGRVLPANPARMVDVDLAAGSLSAKEALWKTAADIPGLFQIEAPPVQVADRDQRSEVTSQQSAISNQQWESKPPRRNILVETFRIYFRGFFQFFCLSLLSIIPFLCSEFTSRFVDTAPGVNVDLRTLVAVGFGLCMFVLWIVLVPVYIAGIQILTAELATGHRIGFLSVLNGAVKYWPRVAGLGLFVWGVFFLLFLFAVLIAIMVAISSSLFSIVLALALLAFQVWLFGRFFINVLFWQQFTLLENANAADALRESRKLARSGQDLPWYQRPLWRGAFIVSLWFAFALTMAIVAMWPRLTAEWPVYRDFFNQLGGAQDSQIVLQKMMANLPKDHGASLSEIGFSVLRRLLQPLLGIAFVVLYLDSKGDDHHL